MCALIIMLFGYILTLGAISYHADMPFHSYNAVELAAKGRTGVSGPLLSTIIVIFLIFIFATPVALGSAIFISEIGKQKWWAKMFVMFALVCNGIPSIVFGILGMLIFVTLLHLKHSRFSIFATACILTLVILPTLFMGVYESLRTVKKEIRYESAALGATKFQTVSYALIQAAFAGIIDSIAISIIRAIGESAPVLFTIGGANFVPHTAFDSGNTLTLLLFQQFQNAAPSSFLYSLAFLIILLMAGVYIFLSVLRSFIYSRSGSSKIGNKLLMLLQWTDLKATSKKAKWALHNFGWQMWSTFNI